jgi:phage terminase Nu1 subunit (DNA packaging protein)
MLISKSEAATVLGVSPAAVTHAIKKGRIVPVERNGKEWIDGETLREQWGNARSRMRNVNSRVPKPGDVGKVSRAAEDLPDYNESRARTEWLRAELMELERAEKEGELVRADEVSKAWGDLVAITRTKMMAVPSKAKQRIPEIPADAFVALEEIVREALEDLANG